MPFESDYRHGDPPVPTGTLVTYHGSHRHGDYEIVEHQQPPAAAPEPDVNYPDGVAYVLWPVNVPKKFGNRQQSVVHVRRRSFRINNAA